jgi:hypothetical protein
MQKRCLYLLALFVSCGILFLGLGRVYAAQDITATPTSVDVTLQPGSVNNGKFTIVNQGDTEYDFTVYGSPYRVSGEEYTPEFTILPNAPNIADWFDFSISESHITPNKSVDVNYTITVPQDAQPGGYYAVAFAETELPQTASGVTLNQRVGVLFYIKVAGQQVESGRLLTWQSSFLQKPPLISTLRLENNGSAHYSAELTVNVRDIFGKAKYTLNTNKVVLPQTVRKITIQWDDSPSFGLFKTNGTVTFLGETHNLPTTYVLVMSQTVRFYLLIALIVMIALVVVKIIINKIRRKKNAAKEPKTS